MNSTRIAVSVVSVLVLAAWAVIGCSSASSSSGGILTGAIACTSEPADVTGGSTECTSCIQSNCASEMSAFDSECSAYVTCEHNCGCTNSCVDSCGTGLAPASAGGTATSGCVSAVSALATCSGMKCSTACETQTTSDGGPKTDAK